MLEITESKQACDIHEFRIENLESRMGNVEEEQSVLHKMSTNLELLVLSNTYQDEKIGNIEKSVESVKSDVKGIIEKPRQDFDKVKLAIITVLCTSAALFFFSKLPEFLASLG